MDADVDTAVDGLPSSAIKCDLTLISTLVLSCGISLICTSHSVLSYFTCRGAVFYPVFNDLECMLLL